MGPRGMRMGRRLHNEEHHSLYRSPNMFRVIKSNRLRWAGHVARMEEGRSAFKILTDKHIGRRPLGRPRRRWEDNIRIDFEEIVISAENWVDPALDRDYWRAVVNVTWKREREKRARKGDRNTTWKGTCINVRITEK